ncbi:MAG: hypothetical protein JST27_00755 [Bacteroidetes bacterium]|nr:hypothetical protein [Bacteroidota bacterium]
MKRSVLLLLGSLLLSFHALSQMKPNPQHRSWGEADSLIKRNLPVQAEQIVKGLYAVAKAEGDQVHMLQAQLFLMRIHHLNQEAADSINIAFAEAQIKTTDFPFQAVWRSIAAQLYLDYYQNNRYLILDRTNQAEEQEPDAANTDFEQWDANQFFRHCSTLYLRSLEEAGRLKSVSIAAFDPVLQRGRNTRLLRPSLFDLLAFRALDFFELDEQDLTKPAYEFMLDDAAAFAPAAEFIRHEFNTQDTLSHTWHALRLYQQVLALHLTDTSKAAFLDADLQRLEFVFQHSVHPEKQALYRQALELIETRYSAHPLAAMASYRLAVLMMGKREHFEENEGSPEKPQVDLRKVMARLDAIIVKYPNSEGGVAAQQLRQNILVPSLGLEAEEAILPGKPSKVLLRYKNVPNVYFRVVRLDAADFFKLNGQQGNDPIIRKLLQGQPIQAFQVALPATEDLKAHSTEIKIEPLPLGMYALLISAKPSFSDTDNALSFALFQSTRLAVLMQREASAPASSPRNAANGFVLNRESGGPVPGVAIMFYKQEWRGNHQGYGMTPAEILKTDAAGAFRLRDGTSSFSALSMKNGEDAFYSKGYLNFYRYSPQEQDRQRVFFFTDRSIYRPGQSIFFKAILLRQSQEQRSAAVLAGTTIVLKFFDVHGQELARQSLRTNEWGSVSGSFQAPKNGLTGVLRIAAFDNQGQQELGNTSPTVEEYKRPKFRVGWDSLKVDYALGDAVTIVGRAEAYAGQPIDAAQVRYRVVRRVRWPFWWFAWRYPSPHSEEQQLVAGTTQTDASGAFKITFDALPDRGIDERSLPVFSYSISAEVTDLNGETRSGETQVSFGYRSLQIEAEIPEQASREDLEGLRVSTEDLNGNFVSANLHIEVAQLKQPDHLFRKRNWPVPDQFVLSEASFRQAFPEDPYQDEDDYRQWPLQLVTNKQSIITRPNGKVALPASAFPQNGWYCITFRATDKHGKPVEEKKFVQVWDATAPGKAYTALSLWPEKDEWEPGENASCKVVSDLNGLHLIRQVQTIDRTETSFQSLAAGKPDDWQQRVTEADRGGIAVSYIGIRNNRVYQASRLFHIPWTNKELHIEWETHRDLLKPGQQEQWTMVVRGSKKEQVAAELAATLYDASLDAFKPHYWQISSLFPTLYSLPSWDAKIGFSPVSASGIASFTVPEIRSYDKSYDQIAWLDEIVQGRGMLLYDSNPMPSGGKALMVRSIVNAPVMKKDEELTQGDRDEGEAQAAKTDVPSDEIPIRKNLQETAFFFPQMQADSTGAFRLSFTIPEALTEWKMLAFAHTKGMSTGFLSGEVKTRKELMVQPGLPRFLRQGDAIRISTKVVNLSGADLQGTARLEIVDAQNGKLINTSFRLASSELPFRLGKDESSAVSWLLHVPESRYEPVIIRVSAKAGSFTDGEENTLPVLSNRMLVTEAMPMWMNGSGTKNFSFKKLATSTSKTMSQQGLTVEYTTHPIWYVVKALPYLMEYPYECSEQTFNRYYANALAAHILDAAPRVKSIFKKWQEEAGQPALKSPLENNQELKSALLEETPWVLDAQSEAQQRAHLALLFEASKQSQDLEQTLRKLEEMELPEGGWPWFKGNPKPNRYITQYILTGIGHLQAIYRNSPTNNQPPGKDILNRMLGTALQYLDREMEHSYQELLKQHADLKSRQIGYTEAQYLYMRSFFKEIPNKECSATALAFYRKQAQHYWPDFNPNIKGMLALALFRNGDLETSADILQSLRETSIQKEETGMYWMQPKRSGWWYDAPIETQSLLIECFSEIARNQPQVEQMKRWLLKQKQTQNWGTTTATADACYALLLTPSGESFGLQDDWKVSITLGDTSIQSSDLPQEAGSGYFKFKIPGAEVRPEMGIISLKLEAAGSNGHKHPDNRPSWGAVYWQYFEDMDKISAAATPLVLKKEWFIEKNSDRGAVLLPITSANTNGPAASLKVGDKVRVRMEIIVDRDMEYVHLKDSRAACFEPLNVLSGYRWQSGLGYYESTRDASTNFFFDYLPKGKYVFEYPLYVTHAGSFSAGLATIQCMYAPEFAAHSEGQHLNVE